MKRPELRQRIARRSSRSIARTRPGRSWRWCSARSAKRPSGHEAAALLAQLAELQEERLGARQLALATWREALRIDPGRQEDPRQRRAAGDAARAAGGAGAGVGRGVPRLATPRDLALRGELLERRPSCTSTSSATSSKARAAWKRLLELDPTNLHTARPAAAALARLYETAEDWRELIDVLHRQAEWAEQAGREEGAPVPHRPHPGGAARRSGGGDRDLSRDPRRGSRDDRARSTRSSSCTRRRRQWPELIEILRRRLELADPAYGTRRDLHVAHRRSCTSASSATPAKRSPAITRSSTSGPRTCRRSTRWRGCTRRGKRPADLLEILERRLALADKNGETALATRCACASPACSTASAGASRRSSAIARCSTRAAQRRRRAPASRSCSSDDDLRLRAAEVLEPHYQTAGELDKLVQLPSCGRSTRPIRASASSACGRSPQLQEQRGRRRRRPSTRWRARRASAVGEPELPQLLDGLERLAPAGGAAASWWRSIASSGPTSSTPRCRSASTSPSPPSRTSSAIARPRASTTGACSTCRPITRRRSTRSRASTRGARVGAAARDLRAARRAGAGRRRSAAPLPDAAGASCARRELDRPMEAIRAYEQVLEMFPHDADAGQRARAALRRRRSATPSSPSSSRSGSASADDSTRRWRCASAWPTLYDEELDRRRSRGRELSRRAGRRSDARRRHPRAREVPRRRRRSASPPPRCSSRSTSARHDWPALVRIYQIRLEAADEHRTAPGARQAHRAALRRAARGSRRRLHLVRQGLPRGAVRSRRRAISWRAWPACSTAGRGWPTVYEGYSPT